MDAARTALPKAALPDDIHPLDALPRGPAGKVRIAELKGLIEADSPQAPDPAVTIDTVLKLAAASFKVREDVLSPDSDAESTPGWDSLAHMELVSALEKTWGIRLSTRDILRIRRLSDAADVVASHRSL